MFQSTSGSTSKRNIVLYVLLVLAGILTIIFVVIFLQYCRTYRTVKEEEREGLVNNTVTPEEYEVSAYFHSSTCFLCFPLLVLYSGKI